MCWLLIDERSFHEIADSARLIRTELRGDRSREHRAGQWSW
jgi:hypothetical protein